MDRSKGQRLLSVFIVLAGACADMHGRTESGVHGRVVDEIGDPIEGARVMADDVIVHTDAEGRFDFPALDDETYDLILATEFQEVTYFQGLSSRTPTLGDSGYANRDEGSAFTVIVPEGDTQEIRSTQFFVIEGVDRPLSGHNFDSANAERPFDLRWADRESGEPQVHAFAVQYEVDPVTNGPARYIGFDEATFPIASGVDVRWEVSWKAFTFPTARLNLQANAPDDYSVWSTRVFVRLDDVPLSDWLAYADETSSILVPVIDGFSYDVQVIASSGTSSSMRTVRRVLPTETTVVFDIDPGPTLLSPLTEIGRLEPGTTFRWDNPAHLPSFGSFGSPDGSGMTWLSAGTEFTVPDLSALGISFGDTGEYTWAVFGTTGDSVDAAASVGRFGDPELDASTYAYSSWQTIQVGDATVAP